MALAVPSRYFSSLVTQLEQELGLSSQDLAGAVGVSGRTVERWRHGALPQNEALKRLDELVALHRRLSETFTSLEAARQWLHHPNEYLRGLRPADALRTGHLQQVHGALEVIDAGIYQ